MLTSVILIIIAAILVGVYVSWRAGRLDRLHARVEAARAAGEPNERAESDLTRALRAALAQPGFRADLAARSGGDEALAELEAAAHQVFLARKFYNDAVAATRAARRRWLVRLLRLAGGAPLPEFFEIDESLVEGDVAGRGADMPHLTAGDPPQAQAG